ncbi:MAG TPA: MarR family winged helix-turn-helix transcriptional regulator [Novosphingobium sp.]|nr:MarR family winged helix-turn-helix transcriptional regulator [Novosphingobium sp.]
MNNTVSDARLTDPVASHLGYLARRASAAMMANLGNALAPLGLRPVEATILLLIAANPGCSQSDAGRLLGIKRANMVPLMAGLLARDLVRKSAGDGRTYALSLTPAGEEARAAATQAMEELESRYQALLEPGQWEALQEGLRRLLETLNS